MASEAAVSQLDPLYVHVAAVEPLTHVDGAVLSRLFDASGSEQSLQIIGEGRP